MLRIAMISTPFIPVPPKAYGGTELLVYELVEGLLDRGHQVTLFATGDSQTRATLHALYDEAIWPPDHFRELDHVSWAMRQAAEGGYDVVHAHSPSALALGRLAPARPWSTPSTTPRSRCSRATTPTSKEWTSSASPGTSAGGKLVPRGAV